MSYRSYISNWMSKSRCWCYTLNNYTEDEVNGLKLIECKYHVLGKEVGEQGTKHIQGYIEFANAISFDSIKSKLVRAHIEKRRGTRLQAADYCKKDKLFEEVGVLTLQGERTDIKEIMDKIKTHEFVIDDHPNEYARYHVMIDKMIARSYLPRSNPPEVYWYYGSSGVGKTRNAVELHGISNTYMKDSSKWWDGYAQQHCIVIDDFMPKDCEEQYRDMLRLLDRYPYQGQIKGGYIHIDSPIIIITCEYAPEAVYKNTKLEQIKRRLTVVKNFTRS